MPLNLQANDGDFTPFIKYNAKAGRWYVRHEGQDGDVEIMNPVLAFDMANIKTGWIFYAEGSGPEKVWDPAPNITAPKPAGPKAFKRGFEVLVYGKADNIGVREFSSTATNMISSILEMYAEYEKSVTNIGKIPVYACKGVKPINGKYGTNYQPLFTLDSWLTASPFNLDKPTSAPPRAWPMEQAVAECSKVGITRDQLVSNLKARGNAGWNGERDTQFVMELIHKASTNGDANEGAGEEIPF